MISPNQGVDAGSRRRGQPARLVPAMRRFGLVIRQRETDSPCAVSVIICQARRTWARVV